MSLFFGYEEKTPTSNSGALPTTGWVLTGGLKLGGDVDLSGHEIKGVNQHPLLYSSVVTRSYVTILKCTRSMLLVAISQGTLF